MIFMNNRYHGRGDEELLKRIKLPVMVLAVSLMLVVSFGGKIERLVNEDEADVIGKVIRSRRSIRRYQQRPVPLEVVREIIEDARYAPSGMNIQPWEFIVVIDTSLVERVYGRLRWLPTRGWPPEGQRPPCYIVVLGNRKLGSRYEMNCAFTVENILLSAWARGLGTCPIGSIEREELKQILNVPDYLDIVLVIALGYPAEEPVAEDARDGDLRPWLDEGGRLHVPKRPLETILHIDGY